MPVESKIWSTATLEAGALHVDNEQELARLTEEEDRLQREIEDCCTGATVHILSSV